MVSLRRIGSLQSSQRPPDPGRSGRVHLSVTARWTTPALGDAMMLRADVELPNVPPSPRLRTTTSQSSPRESSRQERRNQMRHHGNSDSPLFPPRIARRRVITASTLPSREPANSATACPPRTSLLKLLQPRPLLPLITIWLIVACCRLRPPTPGTFSPCSGPHAFRPGFIETCGPTSPCA